MLAVNCEQPILNTDSISGVSSRPRSSCGQQALVALVNSEMNVRQKPIRQEVESLLRPGRLHRLVSVYAQVFQLVDSRWVELSWEPVLVHLILDSFEGITNILSIHHLQLIIDKFPISSNFNVYTPSKKFIHFVSDKFERSSRNYGFGFVDAADFELFNQHLHRLRCAAVTSMNMRNPLFTVTTTPPHSTDSFNENGHRNRGPIASSAVSSPLKSVIPRNNPGSSSTFAFRGAEEVASVQSEQLRDSWLNLSSPYKNGINLRTQMHGGSTDFLTKQVMDLPFMSPGNSDSYQIVGNSPRGASTPLASPQSSPQIASEDATEPRVPSLSENSDDLCAFTEGRLRDFLSSLQLTSAAVPDPDSSTSVGSGQTRPNSNPAGAIGTPIKCHRSRDNDGSNTHENEYDKHTFSPGN